MLDQSEMIIYSDFFIKELEKIDEKYTMILKYGDVHSPTYKDNALKLQGIRELVDALSQPIIKAKQEEEEEKLKEEAKKNNTPLRRLPFNNKIL